MSEGEVARLGEIATIVMGQSPPGYSYNKDGTGLPFLQGSAEFGPATPRPDRWCSEPRKIARPGDILISIRAPVGDVNRADATLAIGRGLAAIRSSRPSVLNDYLEIALRHLAPRLRQRAGGTMFESVNTAALAALVVRVPAVADQRRVVDLIGALNDERRAAHAFRQAAATALDAYLTEAMSDATSRSVALGDTFEIASGPSWTADDECPAATSGTVPVVGIPNTAAGERLLRMGRTVYVRGLPSSTPRLRSDSLVMIRTNGNRSRIGNVYRVPPSAVGHAYSAFQIGLFPRDSADSTYAFWFLSSPPVQRLITATASGSTGLGNVAVSWLRQLRVPWPEHASRRVIADTATAIERTVDAASSVVSGLDDVRPRLVDDLLSGRHVIPESYDRFHQAAS